MATRATREVEIAKAALTPNESAYADRIFDSLKTNEDFDATEFIDVYETQGESEAFAMIPREAFEDAVFQTNGQHLTAAANAEGAKQASSLGLRFDAANWRTFGYINEQSADLVVNIDNGQKQGIRDVLARSQMFGMHPREQSRVIENVVGLHPRWANAVLNYDQRLAAEGIPYEQRGRMVGAYHDRLLRSRAMNIARTETMRAANMGRYAAWEEASAKGLMKPDMLKEWSAAWGACPICGNLSGERVKWNESFSGGIFMPPGHPHCRCTAFLVKADTRSTRRILEPLTPRIRTAAQQAARAGVGGALAGAFIASPLDDMMYAWAGAAGLRYLRRVAFKLPWQRSAPTATGAEIIPFPVSQGEFVDTIYRRFLTRVQAQDYLERLYGRRGAIGARRVKRQAKDSLTSYKLNDAVVNDALRARGRGRRLRVAGEEINEVGLQRQVDQLDGILRDGPRTVEPMAVYWAGSSRLDDPLYRAGSILEEQGYISAAAVEDDAVALARRLTPDDMVPTVMEIRVPTGSKATLLTARSAVDEEVARLGRDHPEIMLDRGAELRVGRSWIDDDGTRHVQVDVLNYENAPPHEIASDHPLIWGDPYGQIEDLEGLFGALDSFSERVAPGWGRTRGWTVDGVYLREDVAGKARGRPTLRAAARFDDGPFTPGMVAVNQSTAERVTRFLENAYNNPQVYIDDHDLFMRDARALKTFLHEMVHTITPDARRLTGAFDPKGSLALEEAATEVSARVLMRPFLHYIGVPLVDDLPWESIVWPSGYDTWIEGYSALVRSVAATTEVDEMFMLWRWTRPTGLDFNARVHAITSDIVRGLGVNEFEDLTPVVMDRLRNTVAFHLQNIEKLRHQLDVPWEQFTDELFQEIDSTIAPFRPPPAPPPAGPSALTPAIGEPLEDFIPRVIEGGAARVEDMPVAPWRLVADQDQAQFDNVFPGRSRRVFEIESPREEIVGGGYATGEEARVGLTERGVFNVQRDRSDGAFNLRRLINDPVARIDVGMISSGIRGLDGRSIVRLPDGTKRMTRQSWERINNMDEVFLAADPLEEGVRLQRLTDRRTVLDEFGTDDLTQLSHRIHSNDGYTVAPAFRTTPRPDDVVIEYDVPAGFKIVMDDNGYVVTERAIDWQVVDSQNVDGYWTVRVEPTKRRVPLPEMLPDDMPVYSRQDGTFWRSVTHDEPGSWFETSQRASMDLARLHRINWEEGMLLDELADATRARYSNTAGIDAAQGIWTGRDNQYRLMIQRSRGLPANPVQVKRYKIDKAIRDMDEALMDPASELPADIIVHRGAWPKRAQMVDADGNIKMQPGDFITDDAARSMTYDQNAAEFFLDEAADVALKSGERIPAIWDVELRKGQHAMFVGNDVAEIILPRRGKMIFESASWEPYVTRGGIQQRLRIRARWEEPDLSRQLFDLDEPDIVPPPRAPEPLPKSPVDDTEEAILQREVSEAYDRMISAADRIDEMARPVGGRIERGVLPPEVKDYLHAYDDWTRLIARQRDRTVDIGIPPFPKTQDGRVVIPAGFRSSVDEALSTKAPSARAFTPSEREVTALRTDIARRAEALPVQARWADNPGVQAVMSNGGTFDLTGVPIHAQREIIHALNRFVERFPDQVRAIRAVQVGPVSDSTAFMTTNMRTRRIHISPLFQEDFDGLVRNYFMTIAHDRGRVPAYFDLDGMFEYMTYHELGHVLDDDLVRATMRTDRPSPQKFINEVYLPAWLPQGVKVTDPVAVKRVVDEQLSRYPFMAGKFLDSEIVAESVAEYMMAVERGLEPRTFADGIIRFLRGELEEVEAVYPKTPILMRRLTDETIEGFGGFTVHTRTGEDVDGWLVSRPRAEGNEETFEYVGMTEEMIQREILDYLNRHADVLAHPDNYFGGWIDGDTVYLDVSVRFDPDQKNAAVLFGIVGEQEAIVHVPSFDEVRLLPSPGKVVDDADAIEILETLGVKPPYSQRPPPRQFALFDVEDDIPEGFTHYETDVPDGAFYQDLQPFEPTADPAADLREILSERIYPSAEAMFQSEVEMRRLFTGRRINIDEYAMQEIDDPDLLDDYYQRFDPVEQMHLERLQRWSWIERYQINDWVDDFNRLAQGTRTWNNPQLAEEIVQERQSQLDAWRAALDKSFVPENRILYSYQYGARNLVEPIKLHGHPMTYVSEQSAMQRMTKTLAFAEPEQARVLFELRVPAGTSAVPLRAPGDEIMLDGSIRWRVAREEWIDNPIPGDAVNQKHVLKVTLERDDMATPPAGLFDIEDLSGVEFRRVTDLPPTEVDEVPLAGRIEAWEDGELVGALDWREHGGIAGVYTTKPGRGIASRLLAEARRADPNVRHAPLGEMSEEGLLWALRADPEELVARDPWMRSFADFDREWGRIFTFTESQQKEIDRILRDVDLPDLPQSLDEIPNSTLEIVRLGAMGGGRPARLRYNVPSTVAARQVDRAAEISWAPDGRITGIWVHPDHTGKGIGPKLMALAKRVNPNLHHAPPNELTVDGLRFVLRENPEYVEQWAIRSVDDLEEGKRWAIIQQNAEDEINERIARAWSDMGYPDGPPTGLYDVENDPDLPFDWDELQAQWRRGPPKYLLPMGSEFSVQVVDDVWGGTGTWVIKTPPLGASDRSRKYAQAYELVPEIMPETYVVREHDRLLVVQRFVEGGEGIGAQVDRAHRYWHDLFAEHFMEIESKLAARGITDWDLMGPGNVLRTPDGRLWWVDVGGATFDETAPAGRVIDVTGPDLYPSSGMAVMPVEGRDYSFDQIEAMSRQHGFNGWDFHRLHYNLAGYERFEVVSSSQWHDRPAGDGLAGFMDIVIPDTATFKFERVPLRGRLRVAGDSFNSPNFDAGERPMLENLSRAYSGGMSVPPLILVERADGEMGVIDGFHRLSAALHSNATHINAFIYRES